MTEATARIKINRLLETAGWRFFAEGDMPANVRLEASVTLKPSDLDAMGENFEKTKTGFIDFLLLDDQGFPLVVLEAKPEDKHPLVGKEQARKYARSQNCRFVILSNGERHYLWDLEHGNPETITTFPSPKSMIASQNFTPNPQGLVDAQVGEDYIVLSQRPDYASTAAWKIESERPGFIKDNNLRFLRDYQLKAVHALQRSVKGGNSRFLFEMATGTGKTLTAAAVIKLFLRTGNARRVLFLVDRLELEGQAEKVFTRLLAADYTTLIYKEKRDDWRTAEIVVSTVQSLQFDNKYQRLFSPTDFDFVISDEAHRSISGNARAVFDYFVGYKLGLTATPRDYLKNLDGRNPGASDPREVERRLLRDTYRTFGCDSGQPTYRYSLLDGVRDGFLINPTVIDARTEVSTQLLAEQGFIVSFTDVEGEEHEQSYKKKEFEKRFFSEATNEVFCKTFLQHGMRDPISREFGKSVIFAVSQNHAAKLTQILNKMADVMYPGRYNSDFAVQVTSQISDAQQFTTNFANNNLMGSGNFLSSYRTSKARVCVTVGMMTTGYDCTDILNLGLFRPIFSPTDFVQMKGRGTRKHDFLDQLHDDDRAESTDQPEKIKFKLFDFFGNYEYFESEYDYAQVLRLPTPSAPESYGNGPEPSPDFGAFEFEGTDALSGLDVEIIGQEGMKIDRMLFERFSDEVRADDMVREAVETGQWDRVIDYVNQEIFNKPEEFYTLEKLRKAAAVDRRLTLREILEKVFDLIPKFKSKDELLEEEFAKFVADHKPDDVTVIPAIKVFFKAYTSNDRTRLIIEEKRFSDLATNIVFSSRDYHAVPNEFRSLIPEYIKDYVPLNQFAA